MELYSLGRLALPVVIAIIGAAGIANLLSGYFLLKRLLQQWRRRQRIRRQNQHQAYGVRIYPPRPALNLPMQGKD